jgi:hypothetical protein
MLKQSNILNRWYRKTMWFFSKRDFESILKYDPLDIINGERVKRQQRKEANKC